MTSLLGYGSLINPASIFARQYPEQIDAIYAQDAPADADLIIPQARQDWQQAQDRISAIPVRIDGL